METQNENQKAVLGKVRIYLDELFEDVHYDDETQHFYVSYGSTVLEISVDPYGEQEAIVMIMSYCVQGVEVDEELATGLLNLNHGLPFGAFSLVGNDIFFHHALFGRTLERSNLLNALAAVATISDDYDDSISAKYGGQRALDRIRSTGGRRRRSALREDDPGDDDPSDEEVH